MYINIITNTVNIGPNKSFELSLDGISSDYLWWIGDDDDIYPQTLKGHLTIKHPGPGAEGLPRLPVVHACRAASEAGLYMLRDPFLGSSILIVLILLQYYQ